MVRVEEEVSVKILLKFFLRAVVTIFLWKVATLLELKASYVPMLPGFDNAVKMLSTVPVVSALLGPVVGLAAAKSQVRLNFNTRYFLLNSL